MKKTVVLIIRDGWGISKDPRGNAIMRAKTPRCDALRERYPSCILKASGLEVGLPEGYQGSSEVGHLNIGAGRIVEQELKRVNDAIEDGSLFSSPSFRKAIQNAKKNNSTLHLMGLVQDEGVHAHQEHLFAIMKEANRCGIRDVCIHFFADGRDTPPRSALGFLKALNEKIGEYGGMIATLMGRYYAMDRGKVWELTTRAYDALTRAEGIRVKTAEDAIERAYREDKCPDGSEMSDEYIPPAIIGDFAGIKDGDSVIHFNYRQDRAIQLTQAFVEDDYPGKRWKRLDIAYVGLTKYYDSFVFNLLGELSKGGQMRELLGEVISKAGLRQLRISETQKFRHVTSFFNGKLIKPFKDEERIEIKSRYDPGSFAEHPQMNAYEVAEAVIDEINSRKYDFILLNFANCDMVGHTGNFSSAVRAVEVVDECVGRVVEAVISTGGIALVTADHGNAEEMLDSTRQVKTSHTMNPVEFIYIASDYGSAGLRDGILSDIAPTVLELLGIPKPGDMTSTSLIKRKLPWRL